MLKGRLALNASALMISSAATGLLGLVYWMVAERMLPTSEVGRASAMISSATLISILATLSLGSLYERFLPVAGVDARRYVRSGLSVVVVSALLFGTTFLFVGPREKLFPNLAEMLVFPFFVVFLAIFAVIYNETGGKFVPVSEIGSEKYMFEGKNGKAARLFT